MKKLQFKHKYHGMSIKALKALGGRATATSMVDWLKNRGNSKVPSTRRLSSSLSANPTFINVGKDKDGRNVMWEFRKEE